MWQITNIGILAVQTYNQPSLTEALSMETGTECDRMNYVSIVLCSNCENLSEHECGVILMF